MTIILWKKSKKILLPVFVLSLLCISYSFANSNSFNNLNIAETSQKKNTQEEPLIGGYENALHGSGDPRSQRIYIQNASSTTGVDYFNISSGVDESISKGKRYYENGTQIGKWIDYDKDGILKGVNKYSRHSF